METYGRGTSWTLSTGIQEIVVEDVFVIVAIATLSLVLGDICDSGRYAGRDGFMTSHDGGLPYIYIYIHCNICLVAILPNELVDPQLSDLALK